MNLKIKLHLRQLSIYYTPAKGFY